MGMLQEPFAILAEPARRKILDELLAGETSVSRLADRLRMTQPSVSKHLRVLRDAGFVSSRTDAQRRIYRLELDRIKAIDAWLEPYRRMWSMHLDALECHLDRIKDQ